MTSSLEALSKALSTTVTQTSETVVSVIGRRSAGTGIHWRNGLIVTSCKALNPGDGLTLGLPNGRTTTIVL
ncbi:MAG: hypothetical protein AAFX01_02265 [Cyanobacteria bacterium J06638_28]